MLQILIAVTLWLNVGIYPFAAAEEQADVSEPTDQAKRFTVPEDPNGNTDTISDLAFSGDGRMLAVAYGHFIALLQEPSPGQTIVWDVESGKRLTTLQSYRDGVSSVDFSKDGELLATGSYDGTVQLWKVPSGHRQARIRATQGTVTSLHFCPMSSVLVVGTWQDGNVKNTVNLYQGATGRQMASLDGHTEGIMSVQFSPDCQAIVSSAMDGTVRIWDAERGTNRVLHQSDTAWFHSVAFSADGQLVAASGGDLQPGRWHIRLWDAKTRKLKKELSGAGEPLRSLTFSHDGKWLAAASIGGKGKLWNLSEKHAIDLLQPAGRIAFSPDGKGIAIGHKRVVTLLRAERLFMKVP